VLKVRELHLAGATVLRGPMGFGAASRIHTAKILRLSMDLPIVIEIVDTGEKAKAFLPHLDAMMGGGLVTLENIKVIHYRDGSRKKNDLPNERGECLGRAHGAAARKKDEPREQQSATPGATFASAERREDCK
jgi:PII-like signaling protein